MFLLIFYFLTFISSTFTKNTYHMLSNTTNNNCSCDDFLITEYKSFVITSMTFSLLSIFLSIYSYFIFWKNHQKHNYYTVIASNS